MPAPILETARLRLRCSGDDDLEPFAPLNADGRVREHFPNRLDREQSDKEAASIRHGMSNHDFGLWAVEVPGSASFIGFTRLLVPCFNAHFTPCVEIGWRLAFDYSGNAGE